MAEAPAEDGTLTPDDAVDVLEELLPAQNKSYELGLKLKLPQHAVEAIHSKELPPDKSLLKVLIKFTHQTEPRPTWRVIIEALKSPAVNLPALARSVEAAHFPDPTATRDVAPDNGAMSPPASSLSSHSQPESIANTESDDKVKLKPPSEHDNEIEAVQTKIAQFNKRFHGLKESTRKQLEKHKVPVEDVADALTSLSPDDAEEVHTKFLKSHYKELFNSSKNSELFGCMNLHWNYLDYHPLDHLVKTFDMDGVKDEMETYKSDLKTFRETTPLALFCKSQTKKRTKKRPDFQEVVATFDWSAKEVTLEDVEKFRKEYADHYNLREFALMLEKVRPGSFIITWLVAETIIPKLKQNIPTELFQEFFITEVTIAGDSVYQCDKSKFLAPTVSSSGYSSAKLSSAITSSQRSEDQQGKDGPRHKKKHDCIDYKLLGKCKFGSKCHCDHINQEKSPLYETVELPENVTTMNNAMRADFVRELRDLGAECSLTPAGSNSVHVVVSSKDESVLPDIVKKYKILLSQVYPVGPGCCYIHHDGLAQCSFLEFRQHDGYIPLGPGKPRLSRSQEYFVLSICETDDSEYKSTSPPEKPERGDSDVTEVVRSDSHKHVRVLFIEDHKDDMKQMLKKQIEWFCKNKRESFALKLEGRFGKLLWTLPLPEDLRDGRFKVEKFKHFCQHQKSIRIFAPCVQLSSADIVKLKFQEERISVLETFDIKFTIPKENKRNAIDVRVKFDQGQPKVLLAKRNEAKILVFDVLHLHRNHDIRMALSHFEVVKAGSPEHAAMEQLLKTMSLSELDKKTITLITKTDDWCVNFIRHKKRETYRYKDKYLITITEVSECKLEREDQKNTEVPIYPDKYRGMDHIECELHNCSWVCAFGRDVGLSPEQSLALLMETPTVEPEVERAIPHPWQPDHILEDFQEFWEILDSINDTLGSSSS